jgi:hypothetical protein
VSSKDTLFATLKHLEKVIEFEKLLLGLVQVKGRRVFFRFKPLKARRRCCRSISIKI